MRWFEAARGRSFVDVALMNDDDLGKLADMAHGHVIDASQPGFGGVDELVSYSPADAYGPDERPVIFGHYGLKLGKSPGDARLLRCAAGNVACVDTAGTALSACGGALTAYRWAGEARLSGERFAGSSRDHSEDHPPEGATDDRCAQP